MKHAVLFALLALGGVQGQEAWRPRLQPADPGSFPMVRPFRGTFRFGWSGIDAAHASARFRREGDCLVVSVEGGTDGLARTLWRLDATHTARIKIPRFEPEWIRQMEKYARRSVSTEVVVKPDGLWRRRQVEPGAPAKWKRVPVEPIRDIVSALLFIRSQPLKDGDRVGLLVYPGDSPFLVEVDVVGRTRLKVAGVLRPALKLRFAIQKIDTKVDNRLVPHDKFRSGTVWVSDDTDRIPLRAEVDLFIGYVFGELQDIQFDPTPTSEDFSGNPGSF